MKTNQPQITVAKDKTFIINLTLDTVSITNARLSVLKSISSEFETKGFRKGKAPINMVEENLSESKVIEEVLNKLISQKYSEVIESNHLHPIIQPQIKINNPPITFDKEWQVEITGCELPNIELAVNYQDLIKKVNSKSKDENDRLNQTMACLVDNSKVDIPEILLKADIENKMSQLVDQTRQAGITVDQYFKSKNQTLEQYQKQLHIQVKNEWITNLAIDKISKESKIEISKAEVDEVITKNKNLAKNLNLVYYLLTQQKVFDFLKKL